MIAKNEFLSHLKEIGKGNKEVTSAIMIDNRDLGLKIVLHPNYSDNEYNSFLKELSFEYNDGYGTQELDGYIWYTDGTWSERYEYDGNEWWEYKKCPSFQDKLEFFISNKED